MNHSKVAHTPDSHAQRQPIVCVVDPNTADYDEWTKIADASNCDLQFLASAADALRLARTRVVDLWVVNTGLPGLSGCELCGMLRTVDSKAPVYLIADEYAPEIEQAAWRARATMFGVKENCGTWIQAWLNGQPNSSRRRSATRPVRRSSADSSSSFRSTSLQ